MGWAIVRSLACTPVGRGLYFSVCDFLSRPGKSCSAGLCRWVKLEMPFGLVSMCAGPQGLRYGTEEGP